MSDDKENKFDKSLHAHRFNDQIDKNTFTCRVEDSVPNKRFNNQIGNNNPSNETTKPVATPPINDKPNKK